MCTLVSSSTLDQVYIGVYAKVYVHGKVYIRVYQVYVYNVYAKM